ncbi:glycosyltransferase [uncultured Streptomyces sp.]|uniref:glycosyltransferase family 2 protein n=1 Tax=uncultured Streptomyces sp. TaxID=174707 RepID=UPI00260C9106|nr:glycosyltransferase family 2 protein [uncultured Streptomyces sp.]
MTRITPASALRRRALAAATVATVLLGYLLLRRVDAFAALGHGGRPPFVILYTLTCAWVLWQTLLAYTERPHRAAPNQQHILDTAHLAILVPLYNEDPALLHRSLQSLLEQTRLPDTVSVTDDGSGSDYTAQRDWFTKAGTEAGIRVVWQRTANRGKRHAQITAADAAPEAQYFVTIDSDVELDPLALHEILQPFSNPDVQSVAAVVLSANARTNWLTRLFDLHAVSWQLNERSAQSVLGSVTVNTGACAAYRAAVIRDHTRAYLEETFLGRPVAFSDDSMLTLLAKLRGRTVQQPTAFARATMPENLSHHLRQQARWMRGSAIRSFWRVRYLPTTSYAFFGQVSNWFMTLATTATFTWIIILQPLSATAPFWALLIAPILFGYLHTLPYLTIRPEDEPLRTRLLVYACTPLATLWSHTVLRTIRWYGLATCARTGWGTREKIEVYADSSSSLTREPATAGATAPGLPSPKILEKRS